MHIERHLRWSAIMSLDIDTRAPVISKNEPGSVVKLYRSENDVQKRTSYPRDGSVTVASLTGPTLETSLTVSTASCSTFSNMITAVVLLAVATGPPLLLLLGMPLFPSVVAEPAASAGEEAAAATDSRAHSTLSERFRDERRAATTTHQVFMNHPTARTQNSCAEVGRLVERRQARSIARATTPRLKGNLVQRYATHRTTSRSMNKRVSRSFLGSYPTQHKQELLVLGLKPITVKLERHTRRSELRRLNATCRCPIRLRV